MFCRPSSLLDQFKPKRLKLDEATARPETDQVGYTEVNGDSDDEWGHFVFIDEPRAPVVTIRAVQTTRVGQPNKR